LKLNAKGVFAAQSGITTCSNPPHLALAGAIQLRRRPKAERVVWRHTYGLVTLLDANDDPVFAAS
jgi:hypothetical protein